MRCPKPDRFIEYYDSIFPTNGKKVRILELGVSRGKSLRVWRKYFSPESVIVGLDVNDIVLRHIQTEPRNNLFIYIAPQDDLEALKRIVDDHGPFDFIIDDASHIGSKIITSFEFLFCHGLKNGGIYTVEDTEIFYWDNEKHEHKRDKCFIKYSKSLVDEMHSHRREKNSTTKPSKWNLILDEVSFRDSMIVFKRKANGIT